MPAVLVALVLATVSLAYYFGSYVPEQRRLVEVARQEQIERKRLAAEERARVAAEEARQREEAERAVQEQERLERERVAAERERLAAEEAARQQAERERLAREALERERIAAEERARVAEEEARQRAKRERLAAEAAEKERKEAAMRALGRSFVIPGLGLQMIRVEPRTFTMGSPPDEPGRDADEVQREVTLTQPFFLGSTEVTMGEWKAIMGTDLKDQVRLALADDTLYNLGGKQQTTREFLGSRT